MRYPLTIRPVRNILLACLFFLTTMTTRGFAQSATIEIKKNEIELHFPNSIEFFISAHSQQGIEEVTLLYGVESESCLNAQARQDMRVSAGETVDAVWEWDLIRSGNLPAGTVIWWQWEIKEQDGTVLLTDVRKERIEDPNFKWKKVNQGLVTVYWAEGSETFGRTILSIATRSLGRLEKEAGLQVDEPIQVIVYPSSEDMRDALVTITEWAGGVAFPQYRVTLIGIPPGEDEWAEEVIPHELAHLVTGMQIFNCQGGYLPTWLSEGLAQYAEGAVTPQATQMIRLALDRDSLPSLDSLAEGFPANARLADQAYYQSWLVVTYLIESYGSEKMDALLANIQLGQSIDKALQGVYGLTTEGIDQDWRASMGYGEAPEPSFATATAPAARTKVPTLALQSPAGKQQATATSTPVTVTETPKATITATPIVATKTAVATATAERLPERTGYVLMAGIGLAGLCVVGLGVIVVVLVIRFTRK